MLVPHVYIGKLSWTLFSFQLGKVVETLTKQLETKGKDLNEYREKYGIRVRGEEDKDDQKKDDSKSSTQGVLVAKDST